MDFDIDMEDVAAAPSTIVDVDNNVVPFGEKALLADVDDKEPGELDDPSTGATAGGASTDENPDTTLVPDKVHLRGLDTLTPDDIKAYLAEHLGSNSSSSTRGSGGGAGVTAFRRIEWIDDSSANLVFADATSAVAAVCALSAVPLSFSDASELPVHELLPAKPFAKSADVSTEPIGSAESAATGLQVRFAVVSDRKQAGAAARSRFYLLHPEYDPEERRRASTHRRGDDRAAVDSYRPGGPGRQKRRYSGYRDDRDDRDRDIRNNTFDASLYDDDGPAAPGPRATRGDARRERRRQSWSRSRSRSRSPSQSRAPWRESNRGKELFADDSGSGSGRNKELFPEKLGNGGRLVSEDTGRAWDGNCGGRERNSRNSRNNRNNRSYRGNNRRDLGYGRLRNSRSASPQRQDGDGFYYDEQGRDGGGAGGVGVGGDDDDYDGRLADARAEEAAAAAARNRDKARAIKDRLAAAAGNGHGADGTHAVTALLRDGNTFSIRGLAGEGSGGLDIKGSALARELFPDRFRDDDGNSSFAVRGQADVDDGEGSGRRDISRVGGRSLESRITRPRQRAKDLFQ